jgi:hypothetical protein
MANIDAQIADERACALRIAIQEVCQNLTAETDADEVDEVRSSDLAAALPVLVALLIGHAKIFSDHQAQIADAEAVDTSATRVGRAA